MRRWLTGAVIGATAIVWTSMSHGIDAEQRAKRRPRAEAQPSGGANKKGRASADATETAASTCPHCGWTAPRTRSVETVRNLAQLRRALKHAGPGTTILLADGDYVLDRTVKIVVPGVVLRGVSGNRDRVVLRGAGMKGGKVGVGISVNARDVTVADLTVGWVSHHGIQVRGERSAGGFVMHNVHLVDTGQQLLKGSVATTNEYADKGLIACSLFEYTDSAPSDYTNGIDILAARDWVVRDNRFERIRGPRSEGHKAGPAIFFWAASGATVVERNIIVDSYRGIALGMRAGRSKRARGQEQAFDHDGGVIRNNVVVNLNAWANEGIEVNSARDVMVSHNTVLVEGSLGWSISARFPETRGTIANNLTNRDIKFRDGGTATLKGNVAGARADWFVDAPGADLHLTARAAKAIDVGVADGPASTDFDRRSRPAGRAPDAGAFEYTGQTAARGSERERR